MAQEWAKLKPPERPSGSEIRIYEKWIKRVAQEEKNPQAIIYGATPELRDLLAKYNFRVTLVDINPNMVQAMRELIKVSKGKEKMVIANWLNIPLKSCKYDLFCCDHGIHHILFKDWSRFLKQAKTLLKPSGYFLNNMMTMPLGDKATVKEMIRIYKRNPKKFSREDKFYHHYRIIIGLKDYQGKKYVKNLGVLNEKLRQFFKQGLINKKDYNFLASPWEGYICAVPPKNIVDVTIKQHFKILSRNIPSGKNVHQVYSSHNIYCLKPK